jgi:Mrp family chromosome partitioning ATPase
LSDYLSGNIDISEILIKTGIGNMMCIPAGRMVNNPVELLSSKKMKTFLNEIKHRYMDRYVIIDTPPVLSCAETISIGSLVDGILFVVKEGHAQGKAIEEALNMLRGQNILGVVFNNASNVNTDGYYYPYSYKYHKREDI